MSVRVMDWVWKSSTRGGSELLMLLNLADFADDDGWAYPSVPTLAARARMSPRNVNHILAALRASGELDVHLNAGPRGTNRYRIHMVARAPLKPASPLKAASPPEACFTPEAPVTLKPVAGTPEAGSSKPLKPASDEPSLNHHEPSEGTPSSSSGLPACPHRELLVLFAEKVPELPQPRWELWNDSAGARDLVARWKWLLMAKRVSGERYAETAADAVVWFGRFFETVAASDFLTGRNGSWHRCTLRWLMNRENFAKVVQGHYANREAA